MQNLSLRSAQAFYFYQPVLYRNSALGVELDGLRINAVLFPEDSFRQGVFRIRFQDGNNGLDDDRPRINAVVGEMDRATGELDAVFKGLLLAMETRKRGQKRRVDIDDPLGKGMQKLR